MACKLNHTCAFAPRRYGVYLFTEMLLLSVNVCKHRNEKFSFILLAF